MANVSLKHIYKVYPNGTKAVNDFNMEIRDKEFIVFVGPSGCGKSTTLRMIAGLEDISAGELKIDDTVVNDMEPKDRDIAMVFQNYALYPHMTVYENIAFSLRLHKLPKDEIHARIVEAAEILGITQYLDKKPKEMSGGQRQRVALGRAIVREPKVMLLDEPLSNLDAKLRTQMRAEISKLHSKLQTTFIYVTHDQVEAMTMGTRIVVMKDGFVQQIDTPKNLYNYPSNKFVAGFIGTPQMNFFEGTLLKSGDEVTIRFDYANVEITVPFSTMYKAKPAYLDGKTKVYIGLRAEDISLSAEDVKNSRATIKVKISHKEELGSETLIYGDIDVSAEDYTSSPTRIIIKDNSGRDLNEGDIVEAALGMDRVHLFDAETEEAVLPRVPEYNYLDCEVKNGKLRFLGTELELPPAIRTADLKGELLLPTDAVKICGECHADSASDAAVKHGEGATNDTVGDLDAKVVACESIGDVLLVAMECNGRRLYAVARNEIESKTVSFSIDFKKITVTTNGETKIAPMPETGRFDCKFIKRKDHETFNVGGKLKRKKTVRFGFAVEGAFFEASDDISQKIFSALGIKQALSAPLKMECGACDMTVSESGIPATVLETLDYGEEKFVKCAVGESTVYVKTDAACGGSVHLMPDFERVGVIETERDIKIV